jgi:tRNA(Ile)-lysidine synthase
MRDADRALSAAAGRVPTGVGERGERSIERDVLRRLPRAVAVKVVSRLLREAGGGQKPHALAAVEALTDRLIREPVRTTLHGCIVRSGGKTIRITREPGREAAGKRRKEPTTA